MLIFGFGYEVAIALRAVRTLLLQNGKLVSFAMGVKCFICKIKQKRRTTIRILHKVRDFLLSIVMPTLMKGTHLG